MNIMFSGTKAGMQELIDKANQLNAEQGKHTNYTIESYADIVNAIHDVQTEMDITGTTADEAMNTISGSVDMTKSSWSNLVTGIADENANFSELVANFVESLGALFENIMPRVAVIVDGIVQLIASIGEKLMEHAPQIMAKGGELLQSLFSGMHTALPALMPILSKLISSISNFVISNLPEMLSMGVDMLLSLINGIANSLPKIIPQMVKAVTLMVGTLISKLPQIIATGINLITGLVKGIVDSIPKIIEQMPIIVSRMVTNLINNLPQLISAGFKLIVAVSKGLIQSIPNVLAVIPKIITGLWDGLINANWSQLGRDMVKGICSGLTSAAGFVASAARQLKNQIMGKIKGLFGIHSPSRVMRDEIGLFLAEGVGVGFEEEMKDVSEDMANAIPRKFDTAADVNLLSTMHGGLSIGNASPAESPTSTSSITIEELKTALRGLKIELDGEEMGHVVDKQVSALVYA